MLINIQYVQYVNTVQTVGLQLIDIRIMKRIYQILT